MKSRNYSAIYRIMHWSIAFCMTLMLITIFLRMTWMNKNNVALIMQDYLSTTNQSLSQDQLILLAKKIRKPMWDWHVYIGYALVGLYSIRLALPFFGHMKFSNPFTKGLVFKEKIQCWTYLVFYACVAISLITGLIIVLGPENSKKSMEDIHDLSIYYLLTFIVIHLATIFFSEFTNQQGLISRIISGSQKKN
ncbi:cytochrome b/b6 domain-containing protein [Flavobacterium sp. RSP49]|uniref:cytochrome b/b6 domain-containing protein n=1 Tax=Flavobacterium sp. RSP49 TaxID=2497487 RepID=UPI000F84BB0B|nr:cytochrome b/b6 domain-containing protein [Flavobacterium sp. RSP49]RTZ01871.1 cytochrome b/b6 domain-containing protein [Flavobacterium sp. RSP49]